ncbi:hypothetical protein ACVRZR_05870 [Streptococcus entericus]
MTGLGLVTTLASLGLAHRRKTE